MLSPPTRTKCLFTKGQIIEIFQDLINPGSPKITQVVNEGQLSVIKPMLLIYYFPYNLLNLVRVKEIMIIMG